jgi:hypothetical protein
MRSGGAFLPNGVRDAMLGVTAFSNFFLLSFATAVRFLVQVSGIRGQAGLSHRANPE